jgi:hypothetical protein
MKNQARTFAAITAVSTLVASSAYSATWTNPDGGLFSDDNNWDPSAPTATDTAEFDFVAANADYTVSFDADAASSNLFVRRQSVTFDLAAFRYDAGPTFFLTNINREGSFAILGDSASDNRGTLAATTVSLVTGNGSDGDVKIGGALVTASGAVTGSSGTDTSLALMITDGAHLVQVIDGSQAFVNNFSSGTGSTANIEVTGEGSLLALNRLNLGGTATAKVGVADLTVGDGASLLLNRQPTGAGNALKLKVWDGSTLTLENGTVGVTSENTFARRGIVEIAGTLQGIGKFELAEDSGTLGYFSLDNLVGGVIAPGTATTTGMLQFEDTEFTSAGTLAIKFANPSSDQIILTSAGRSATITGDIEFSALDGFSITEETIFDVLIADSIDFSGSSNFESFLAANELEGTLGVVTLDSGEYAGFEALRVTLVPEPASAMLVATGGALMLIRRRGRNN